MFTYLVCCAADSSAVFSLIMKVDKEVQTIKDFYALIPLAQAEAETAFNKKFESFGVLGFTKLVDEEAQ